MEEWTAKKEKIEWRGTLRTGGRGGGENEDRKEEEGLLERNNHDVVIQMNAKMAKREDIVSGNSNTLSRLCGLPRSLD